MRPFRGWRERGNVKGRQETQLPELPSDSLQSSSEEDEEGEETLCPASKPKTGGTLSWWASST